MPQIVKSSVERHQSKAEVPRATLFRAGSTFERVFIGFSKSHPDNPTAVQRTSRPGKDYYSRTSFVYFLLKSKSEVFARLSKFLAHQKGRPNALLVG